MFKGYFFAILLVIAAPLAAEPQIMSAPQASSAVNSGEMILIDIRSPTEWAETGVAKGAVALTMHSPDFGQKISALLGTQQDKTIGLICVTGGRTEYVVSILAKNGFDNVVDVSEGMMGNGRGAGWIARGMPLIAADEAQAAYRILSLKR
ncbi:MAG: rhodanese-related sulfurtransferase [Ascidiaceihabitans sp.]|jgi:rhodanese-related sulfurtransferase